jgi:hypothetical protein
MEIVPAQGKLRQYELTIWLPGKGAKRDLVKGLSLNHAIQVARNLYPNCMVEVPPEAAPKPRLARSHAGPKEGRNRRLKLVEKKQNEHTS